MTGDADLRGPHAIRSTHSLCVDRSRGLLFPCKYQEKQGGGSCFYDPRVDTVKFLSGSAA
jgi:hypothetical protein